MHGDLEYHYSYCLYIRKLPLVVPCLQGMIIIDGHGIFVPCWCWNSCRLLFSFLADVGIAVDYFNLSIGGKKISSRQICKSVHKKFYVQGDGTSNESQGTMTWSKTHWNLESSDDLLEVLYQYRKTFGNRSFALMAFMQLFLMESLPLS